MKPWRGRRRHAVAPPPAASGPLFLLVLAALMLAACAGRPRRAPLPALAQVPAPTGAATTTRGHDDTSRAQSDRYRQRQDGGPENPVDVSTLAEPVPRAEAPARYGNKPVYSVLGKTYRLLPDARGYVERGTASWYGSKFHGYLTSSFEPYDMYAFSAAHKTLPLPSYVRVTNLENGKSVVVRVNDRGPFHDDRLIDLSYAAAVRIGVWPKGTARVEVRALEPAGAAVPAGTVAAAPAAAREARASRKGEVYLQLGAFGDRDNAERALARARRAGLRDVGIDSASVDGRTLHRVRIGPLPDVAAADALASRAQRLGLGTPRVSVENPG